jgi:hypothetical protein
LIKCLGHRLCLGLGLQTFRLPVYLPIIRLRLIRLLIIQNPQLFNFLLFPILPTTGGHYVGLTLDWDYANGTCNISMPGYIARALTRFDHPMPTRKANSPYPWNAPVYGSRQQFATHDNTPFIDAKDKLRLQEVLGTLLYYGHAVDATMLPSIGTITTQQATPTQATIKDLTQLLNYCATHPDAIVRFTKSDMLLHVPRPAPALRDTIISVLSPLTHPSLPRRMRSNPSSTALSTFPRRSFARLLVALPKLN